MLRTRAEAVLGATGFLECVERAGPDVAFDDAKRGQHEVEREEVLVMAVQMRALRVGSVLRGN